MTTETRSSPAAGVATATLTQVSDGVARSASRIRARTSSPNIENAARPAYVVSMKG